MTKPMPYKPIRVIEDMSNVKLDEFFGFCSAEITLPKGILRPLLPCKN